MKPGYFKDMGEFLVTMTIIVIWAVVMVSAIGAGLYWTGIIECAM